MFISRKHPGRKSESCGPRNNSVINTGRWCKTVPPVTLRIRHSRGARTTPGLHLQGTMAPSSPDLNSLAYLLLVVSADCCRAVCSVPHYSIDHLKYDLMHVWQRIPNELKRSTHRLLTIWAFNNYYLELNHWHDFTSNAHCPGIKHAWINIEEKTYL